MGAHWIDCGLFEYQKAYALQTRLVELCRKNNNEYYLVLEHPPVFTLGRRGGKDHLGVDDQFLKKKNINVIHIERGGDITYHGPGQLIVYPIFSLRQKKISVSSYVSILEEIMLRTAADVGITAERNSINHGIWVNREKLGSIGIAIRHGVSFHGLGLNINTNLSHFDWINPCGLTKVKMTSFQKQKNTAFDISQIKQTLQKHFCELLANNLQQLSFPEIEKAVTS